ncbi:MAG: hypothetical protein WA777_11190 [Rhodanobacter sp.]
MSRNQGKSMRNTVLAGLFALGLTTSVFAQSAAPATGLGQSWPNAPDVSSSTNWHVYVFYLNGIKYVQVNDLNGNVHAAVGAANGATIVLPVGVDAQHVTTATTSVAPKAAAAHSTVVYSDSTTTITATPLSNGTTSFVTQEMCGNVYNCTGGGGA